MRITRETLLQSTRQFVSQLLRRDRRMVCIYLVGSLLNDDPQLGGTADIDLVFIHDGEIEREREIIVLSDEVHFDIAHLPQSAFRLPRELRTTPWLAPSLCGNPICLHDTQHWFDFTQASVCAQYDRPDYLLQRARWFAGQSREGWMALKTEMIEGKAEKVLAFLKALEQAANAIVSLTSAPLAERRFLLLFPARAEAIGRPGLSAGFEDMIMPQPVAASTWETWLIDWEEAFLTAGKQENAPARLHPLRLDYYRKAAAAMRTDHPAAALWPILRTWALAVHTCSSASSLEEKWCSAVQSLGLDPENMQEPVGMLDIYLDNIEETLDLWAQSMGL